MNRLMLDYNVLYIVLVAVGLVFFGAVFLSTRPAQRAKPVKKDRSIGERVVDAIKEAASLRSKLGGHETFED